MNYKALNDQMMFIISSQQAEEIAFVPLKKIYKWNARIKYQQKKKKRKGNEEYMMGNIGAVTT